jgi:hypothetical protein
LLRFAQRGVVNGAFHAGTLLHEAAASTCSELRGFS